MKLSKMYFWHYDPPTGHGGGNGKDKSLSKANGSEKYKAHMVSDIDAAQTTTSLMISTLNDVKNAYKGRKKPLDYSSEEYKTWLYDRRLQNKLKRERTEKYQQQLPPSLQQRQQQRLKPISSRDRAKLALSESRQKMAQSQFGPKTEYGLIVIEKVDECSYLKCLIRCSLPPSAKLKHGDLIKKKLTATGSQTTPSIEAGFNCTLNNKFLTNY